MRPALHRRRGWILAVLALLTVAAALGAFFTSRDGPAPDSLEDQAQRYVSLGLAYARIDERALDSYFGPEELRPDESEPVAEIGTVRADLIALRGEVAAGPGSDRQVRLLARIDRLLALIDASAEDSTTPFDDEGMRLYAIAIPPPDEARLREVRAELAALLPGDAPLAERVARFQSAFIVPEDRREAVFERALAECRSRTAAHWPLAANEMLEVEWTGSVDAAWHRYLGDGQSTLQVNPRAVAYLGSALDIACHEAYPGHHAQFLALAEGGIPVEETLAFIRSPEQVLREGAAEYGTALAFPLAERAAFLRETLLPLAGLDPDAAETFVAVQDAQRTLAAATTPILRDFLDGRSTRFDAASALAEEALVASPLPLLGFVAENRSYVLGYIVARDLVERCVEARGGDSTDAQWQALYAIVAGPDLSALQGEACGG